MKKIILLTILFGLCCFMNAYAQCDDCPKDKGISTNPVNPENCEVEDEFPTNTNQFLNTFDWADNENNIFKSIILNPYAGWQVPDFNNPNAPLSMQSPFYQGYLAKPGGTPINDFDFHWEDGWELMYINTGYFPNGDVYHDPDLNSNPIVTSVLGLQHQRIPYIIFLPLRVSRRGL